MKFTVSDPVHLSAQETFTLLRDEMTALVPFMPDTDSIEVLERHEGDGEVRLVNRWRANNKAVPGPLQKIITPEVLSWLDHATWRADTLEGAWRLEAAGGALYSCTGVTAVSPRGAQATLSITVDLEVYPERLPGVPSFVAKALRSQIEKFLGDLLGQNMRQLAQSINQYAANKA
ncbi:MAG: hypothetical protein FJ138_13130 [Deltaproteobacteria bacterium]|nr:hypothetical protein [Deltaproteobacteria bacterium]